MSKISSSTDISNVKPEESAKFVDLFFQDVANTINGNLDFATNFNAKFLSLNIVAANTDTPLTHGLGRVPQGYLVGGTSAATSVYNGVTVSTTSVIYLRASVPATVTVLVF